MPIQIAPRQISEVVELACSHCLNLLTLIALSCVATPSLVFFKGVKKQNIFANHSSPLVVSSSLAPSRTSSFWALLW